MRKSERYRRVRGDMRVRERKRMGERNGRERNYNSVKKYKLGWSVSAA